MPADSFENQNPSPSTVQQSASALFVTEKILLENINVLDFLFYFQSVKAFNDIERTIKHINKKFVKSTGKEMTPKKEWEMKWYLLTHKNNCE